MKKILLHIIILNLYAGILLSSTGIDIYHHYCSCTGNGVTSAYIKTDCRSLHENDKSGRHNGCSTNEISGRDLCSINKSGSSHSHAKDCCDENNKFTPKSCGESAEHMEAGLISLTPQVKAFRNVIPVLRLFGIFTFQQKINENIHFLKIHHDLIDPGIIPVRFSYSEKRPSDDDPAFIL